MLSWFGAIRMKRRPLWLEEQRHLVRFHTHQSQFQNFITGPHTVKLPSEEQVIPMESSTAGDKKETDPSQSEDAAKSGVGGGTASGTGDDQATVPQHPQTAAMMQPGATAVTGSGGASSGGGSGMPPGAAGARMGNIPHATGAAMNQPHQMQDQQYPPGMAMRQGMMPMGQQPQYMRPGMNAEQMRMREKLRRIHQDQMGRQQMGGIPPPPMYPAEWWGRGEVGGWAEGWAGGWGYPITTPRCADSISSTPYSNTTLGRCS